MEGQPEAVAQAMECAMHGTPELPTPHAGNAQIFMCLNNQGLSLFYKFFFIPSVENLYSLYVFLGYLR